MLCRPAKEKKIIEDLASLRASNPEEPMVSTLDLRACRVSAKHRIPEILGKFLTSHTLASKATLKASLFFFEDRLKSGAEKKDQWSFYGHLTTYWASIFGHCSGVFQNMSSKEVEDAHKTASEGQLVINVSGSLSVCLSLSFCMVFLKKCLCRFLLFLQISAHKTNQAFGAAQLALDQEKYGWM